MSCVVLTAFRPRQEEFTYASLSQPEDVGKKKKKSVEAPA
jgi:hypothetical protein